MSNNTQNAFPEVNIIKNIIKNWDNEVEDSKYSIGEFIKFYHKAGNIIYNIKGEIIGVNDTGNGIEYAIKGVPFLLWEEELIKIEDKKEK
jgi:hypothetical protein